MDTTELTPPDEEASAEAEPDATVVGRYRLRGILGRGGMGIVFRAEDLELGELVALKIVTKGGASDAALERQRDEVRLARRVTHPNVARTYDIGEHDGMRFITMELVDGTSLRHIIGGATPLVQRLSLLGHVASGLAAIHDADIAHRDLKPENVLVSATGIAKITDFGIARNAGSLESGMTTGTPRYMAPEVLGGAAPTRAADVYAFGLLAYETVLGQHFSGSDPATLERDLQAVLGEGRGEVAAFIARCVSALPERRPPSVRPLEALLAREAGAPVMPIEVAPAPRARIAACTFVTDAADAWLADSIPTKLLRALAKSDRLEVVSALLPVESLHAAPRQAIDVALTGSAQRVGDELRLSVRLVSVADRLQLWARNTTCSMDGLAVVLGEMARLAGEAMLGRGKTERTVRNEDPRVTELVLRALHEDNDPWRDFSNRAAELLLQADALAPDDAAVLAALAQALLRGGGTFDAGRYHRARRAAERAVELDGENPDCQLALAVTLFVGNDPLGAVTSLRSTLRGAPSMPDVHGLIAAMAVDIGQLHDGVGRSALAIALEPAFAIARVTCALGREYSGEHAAADALLDGGLAGDAPLGRWLCAIAAARFAIWRGTDEAMAHVMARFAALRGLPFIEPLVAALERTMAPATLLSSMGALAAIDPEWARQRCLRLQLEAELLIHRGDPAGALLAIEEIVAAGSYDIMWLRHCPAVVRLGESVDLTALRERVDARAENVRRALAESGLTGTPRPRRGP